MHDDYRWVVVENGVPFNHHWRDYKQSLSTWINAGWNDGDPSLYRYVGHPVQGALTSYIQIQNDPQGFNLTAKGGGGVHIITRGRRSFDLGLGVRNAEFNELQVTVAYH